MVVVNGLQPCRDVCCIIVFSYEQNMEKKFTKLPSSANLRASAQTQAEANIITTTVNS